MVIRAIFAVAIMGSGSVVLASNCTTEHVTSVLRRGFLEDISDSNRRPPRNVPRCAQLTIVVGTAPGGGTDMVAREMAERLRTYGLNAVVENRAGAAGTIAANYIKSATTEGDARCRVMVASNSVYTSNHLYQAAGTPRGTDFKPLGVLAEHPWALVVPKNSPHRTVASLIAAMRARGADLTAGAAGEGSPEDLILRDMFHRMRVNPAPEISQERGTSAVMTALQADGGRGTYDFAFTSPGSGLELIRSGNVRALAVTDSIAGVTAPELSTVVDGFPNTRSWIGMSASQNMPTEASNALNEAVACISDNSELRQKLNDRGYTLGGGSTSMADRIRTETAAAEEIFRSRQQAPPAAPAQRVRGRG